MTQTQNSEVLRISRLTEGDAERPPRLILKLSRQQELPTTGPPDTRIPRRCAVRLAKLPPMSQWGQEPFSPSTGSSCSQKTDGPLLIRIPKHCASDGARRQTSGGAVVPTTSGPRVPLPSRVRLPVSDRDTVPAADGIIPAADGVVPMTRCSRERISPDASAPISVSDGATAPMAPPLAPITAVFLNSEIELKGEAGSTGPLLHPGDASATAGAGGRVPVRYQDFIGIAVSSRTSSPADRTSTIVHSASKAAASSNHIANTSRAPSSIRIARTRQAAPSVRIVNSPDSEAAPSVRIVNSSENEAAPSVRIVTSPDNEAAPSVRIVNSPENEAAPSVRIVNSPENEAAPSVRIVNSPENEAAPSVRIVNSSDSVRMVDSMLAEEQAEILKREVAEWKKRWAHCEREKNYWKQKCADLEEYRDAVSLAHQRYNNKRMCIRRGELEMAVGGASSLADDGSNSRTGAPLATTDHKDSGETIIIDLEG